MESFHRIFLAPAIALPCSAEHVPGFEVVAYAAETQIQAGRNEALAADITAKIGLTAIARPGFAGRVGYSIVLTLEPSGITGGLQLAGHGFRSKSKTFSVPAPTVALSVLLVLN